MGCIRARKKENVEEVCYDDPAETYRHVRIGREYSLTLGYSTTLNDDLDILAGSYDDCESGPGLKVTERSEDLRRAPLRNLSTPHLIAACSFLI